MKKLIILVLMSFFNFHLQAGEIVRITESNIDMVPNGRSLDAIYGDWIMKNDKVIAVIGNAIPGREANMRAQSIQGSVIDFTSISANNDYLVAYYPQADSRSNPAVFADDITVLKGVGSEIVLRVTRNPSKTVPYLSVTEYSLRDGENFLRINTTYRNTGKESVVIDISDKIRLDQDIIDATPIGHHDLAFIYNKWFKAAYGIYSPNGLFISEKPITGHDPGVGLGISVNPNKKLKNESGTLVLKPKDKVHLSRYLFYGKDVAEIQNDIIDFGLGNNKAFSTIFKVSDNTKLPIKNAYLKILSDDNRLVSYALTDENGIARVPLSKGAYKYQGSKIGHDTISNNFSVSDKSENIQVVMKPLTSIVFDVEEVGTKELLPLQLKFKGINGTKDPFLGTSKSAEGANNYYYTANNGRFEVPISPGEYLITISHGPKYDVKYSKVNIKRGEKKFVKEQIKRAFVSPKWIIADFHNHTAPSGDNDSETSSRIINFAAAGIEFAPATEHNRISSYSNEIKELGLERYTSSAPGIELTSTPGKTNHHNAFPLKIEPGAQGGGFSGIDPDPFVQLKGLYNHDDEHLKFIQHNHPNISMLYFDKNMDGIIDGGYGTRKYTDAIEIQDYMFEILNSTSDNAKSSQKKNRVFYWLQMLNQGDRIYGTTTSDNHNVGPGSGERFVYVYTLLDTPSSIDALDIASNAKRGHMVMSNGPFIKTNINGYLPGDEIKSDGNLKMNIEVFANNEFQIDRVQLLINGEQSPSFNFTNSKYPELFNQNPLQFSHSFSLELKHDSNVIVVATGQRIPTNVETTETDMERPPMAIANPFFIDLNWDGYLANKNTLGEDLPVFTGKME